MLIFSEIMVQKHSEDSVPVNSKIANAIEKVEIISNSD
jgi:hypothetical protein